MSTLDSMTVKGIRMEHSKCGQLKPMKSSGLPSPKMDCIWPVPL